MPFSLFLPTDRNVEVRTIHHLYRNPASIIHHEKCHPHCYGRRYVFVQHLKIQLVTLRNTALNSLFISHCSTLYLFVERTDDLMGHTTTRNAF